MQVCTYIAVLTCSENFPKFLHSNVHINLHRLWTTFESLLKKLRNSQKKNYFCHKNGKEDIGDWNSKLV